MSTNNITDIISGYIDYNGKHWATGDNETSLSSTNFGASSTTDGIKNTYLNTGECYAFSLFFSSLLFGSSPEIFKDGDPSTGIRVTNDNWMKYTGNLSSFSLQPGDVIRTSYYADGLWQEHSAVIWYIENGVVYVAEVWGSDEYHNQINFGTHNGGYGEIDTLENLLPRLTFVYRYNGEAITPEPETPKVPVTFKKNINANGGPDVGTVEYVVGEKYGSFPSPGTREGYNFEGWYTSTEPDAGEYSTDSIVRADRKEIWARWSYSVTMYYCNGSGGYSKRTAIDKLPYGTELLADPPAGTMPSNYRFDGWYTAESGGTKIESTDQCDGTNILFAHWVETVTVSFYDDSLDNEGKYIEQRTYIVGERYDAEYEDYTKTFPSLNERTGYRFDTWYMASGGNVEYWSNVRNDITKLYAHWDANQYDLWLYPNYGEDNPVHYKVTYDQPYGTALDDISREGYTFNGWRTERTGDDSSRYETTDIVKATYPHSLYAHWTANTYDVTLNKNDGTNVSEVESFVFGGTYGEKLGALEDRYGYTFKEWNTQSNGEGVSCDENSLIEAKNLDLYAIWEAKKMKVTYDFGIDGFNDTVYDNVEFGNKYGTNIPGISVVHELGKAKKMEFAGWYHPEVTSDSDVKIDTDHTIHAMWEPHKVSFSAGYSKFTDAVPDITVKQGERYGVLPTPRSTDMYKFSYWTYENGDEYVVCDAGTELAVAADHTLTANWETRRFVKFIYENENGEETTKGCSQAYGCAYRGVPTIPEKAGYTFKWVFSEEGSLYNDSEFSSGMLVIPDHPNTIRAVYTAVTTD